MIPGAPENKRMRRTIPRSPIHATYKLGYSQPFLRCDCGATLDLNKEANKTKAGEAFRLAHEECHPVERMTEHAECERPG